MRFFKWLDSVVKKLTWVDVHCIEWAAIFAGLFIAKIFPQILIFDWYWYLILMLLFSIKPVIKMFK